MARFNSSLISNTITGTASVGSPYNGSFTALTGTAPYTVTLANPTLFPGINQQFYNSTSGTVTLSTPAGNFTGAGGSATSTLPVYAGNVVSVTADGTNYIVISEDGSALTATSATVSGVLTVQSSGGVAIAPSTTGNIDNVNVGATTRGSGAFNTLTSNNAVTFTANTASSSTGTGTLVVTGGLGVSGTINATSVSASLTGTIQTAAQANITSLGTLTSLNVTGAVSFAGGYFTSDTNGSLFTQGNTFSTNVPNGAIGINSTASGGRALYVTNKAGNTAYETLYVAGIASQTNIFRVTDSAGSTLFKVDGSGNVGIGTDSPAYKLDNQGTERAYGFTSTVIGTPTAPSGTSAPTGGSLPALTTYYFKIVAVDGLGGVTLPSPEYAGATTTSGSATCTVNLTWTAVVGAKSYQVWYSSSSGTQANYFAATTNSYIFTTTTGNTAGTIPAANSTGKILINTASFDTAGLSVSTPFLAPLAVQGPVNGLLGADVSLHNFATFAGSQFGSTFNNWGGGITLKPIYARGATVFLGALNDGTNMEGGAHFVIRSGNYQNNTTEKFRVDSSGNVGIGTSGVNSVFDQVSGARPLVVQKSDTNTALNSSLAAITITNSDTTTSNTAQLNFAAITGASTNQYSSAIISTVFGARTDGQYPTGQLVFSTSSALNNAPTEKMRITSGGQFLFGRTDENLSRWGRANFYYPSGASNATIALQNSTARAANNLYGMIFVDNADETNAAVYVRQTGTNNGADLLFGTNAGVGGAGISSVTERMRVTAGGALTINNGGAVLDTALLTVNCTAGTGSTIPLALRVGVDSDGYGCIIFKNQSGTQGNINVNTNNISIGGVGGITFKATQVPSADVNTLDDYEEGTWTPNVSSNNGTGTFTVKAGNYVKIGKQVTVWFRCDGGNSLAAGTTQYVSGLPFNVGTYSDASMVGSMGTNGPTIRLQNLLTLTANRAVLYVYVGGSQEGTTISYASGVATYFID